jgi:CRISPR system Cascade subunit CasD
MDYLVFQLHAPLAAWGDTAVGEYRSSLNWPGESAVIGLLGAALGVRREEEAAHTALRQGYRYAVGVVAQGTLLRDYHTAQVPGRADLKKRPHQTRRDELAVPKHLLNTVLSTRDYRQNGTWRVAIEEAQNPPHSLKALADALAKPRFVLYLGRKSCPLAAPLDPRLIASGNLKDAFEAYRLWQCERLESQRDRHGYLPLESPERLRQMAWPDHMEAGIEPDLTTVRKDRLLRRGGWQFADRFQHVVMLVGEY